MKKEFQIRIPEPCKEDWNNMTSNEKGRFCASCTKTVVDFSKKTNEEIQAYFTKHRNDKVCGRFLKTQIDSLTIELPIEIIHEKLPFQKLFILALLLIMGSTLFSCNLQNGKTSPIEEIVIIDSSYTPAKRIDQNKLNEMIDSLIDDPISLEEIESLPDSQDKYFYVGMVSLEEYEYLKFNPNFNLDSIKEIEIEEEIIEDVPEIIFIETMIVGEVNLN